MIPHVHCLWILQHNDVLGHRLLCHSESRNCEIYCFQSLRWLEVSVRQDHTFDWFSFAKCVMPGWHGHSCQSWVKVLKNSISQPHPLVGNHLAELWRVSGCQEGVREVDELSRVSAAQRLLGPGEGAVHGMVPGHQNVARLNVIRSISYQATMGAGGASCWNGKYSRCER